MDKLMVVDGSNLLFQMFKTNNCNKLSQELGLAPPSRVVRFYYEKSTAKRDLLEDLKAVSEGYTVIHEIDSEKREKERKRKEKEERENKKKQKILKLKKSKKEQQLLLDLSFLLKGD